MKKEIKVLNDCRGMCNSDIIDAILESREIKDIEHFLNPEEGDLLPLTALYRIEEAGKIIIDGLTSSKKFLVLADVDTDGCTSTAIIVRYLRSLGVNVDWIVNDTKIHGCNEEIVSKVKEINPDIFIIVDSLDGTINYYKEISKICDIVILDHHDINPELEEEYDKYAVLVSSNRYYKNDQLSGAGVVLKFCLYLDSLLGTMEAEELYDLGCCGILADVMSVDEEHKENRYIVHRGLNNLKNPFVKKIVGGYQFDSQSVLFSVAPLINSAARFGETEDAISGLLADDNKEVLKHLKVLKNCKERQTYEVNQLLPELIEECDAQKDNKMLFCSIDAEGGITGLLASKLCDMHQKPVIVAKEKKTGYSGSLRAVGVDDFRGLCEATGCGEFAGHSSASGATIPYNKYDEFREKIEAALSEVELKQELTVDAELNPEDANEDLLTTLKAINRISGQGFKPITFAMTIDDYDVKMVGEKQHMVATTGKFQFVKWNAGEKFCENMEEHAMFGDSLTFVGSLDAGFLAKSYALKLIVNDIIEN